MSTAPQPPVPPQPNAAVPRFGANSGRWLLVVAGCVAASLLVGCCVGGALMWSIYGWHTSESSPGADSGQVVFKAVSLKHYESIGFGQTYGDVVRIVGREGKLIFNSADGGYQRFIWTNADGSNMTAEFVNGDFADKKQSGLK